MKRTNADSYQIDDDPARIDRGAVHTFLTSSYWSTGISKDTVDRAIQNSWCFGLYRPDGDQCGFARIVTDYAVFAYLADVFVLDADRGRGLGKWLIGEIFDLPELKSIRWMMLATRDAHTLYQQVGFQALGHPDRLMEVYRPDIFMNPEK